MRVAITIPAFNEEKTLGKLLPSIKEVMEKQSYEYNIIVVDDGSNDNTADIAKKNGALVYSHPRNFGLSETFRTEMEQCLKSEADIIVHIDADGQYLPKQIPSLIDEVKKGHQLVLGSRFKGRIESMPVIKRFGNKLFSIVISRISGYPISDAQTGFRAFTRDVAKLPIISSFTYTQEQIIRVSKSRMSIKEIPIHFAERGGNTKSRLMRNPFDFALKAGVNLLRIYRDYEPLKFFGLFGFVFILVGSLLGVFIINSILATGSAGGLPRVILSALLLLTGIQIGLFGFLADMQKK